MLSASSVLMDVLENKFNPSIKEEQLSLNNTEVISLGDSSPRSTISSSLIEIEEISEGHRQHAPSFQDENHHADQELDDEFNRFVLMEHCYDKESEDELESNHHNLSKSSPNNKSSKNKAQSNIQHEGKSFQKSSRTSFLKGTTTTTLFTRNPTSSLNGSFGFGSSSSRFSLDTSLNINTKPKSPNGRFERDVELENELLGHNRPTTPSSKSQTERRTSPISKKSVEVTYTPPSNLSSITLKDKKEIEKSVERLKVRQRYLEDRVKRESTPPKGRVVPPKSRVYTSSESVITKLLNEKEPVLTLAQLQNSLEMEKRKKRIEEKRRELQESKNLRAKAIREEKQRRETYLKEDSILSRHIPEVKRPSTPSLTKRSTTSTNLTKRPSSSVAGRPISSISIETVKPQKRNNQQANTTSRIAPKDLFDKHNSFLSDSTYRSPKDVKDFNALLKEQEKLLNNIRELKNKIQPSSKKL